MAEKIFRAVKLFLVPEKGVSAQPVDSLDFCTDGIKGDRSRGCNPERHLCLLTETDWDKIGSYTDEAQIEQRHGFCTKKIKPNMVFSVFSQSPDKQKTSAKNTDFTTGTVLQFSPSGAAVRITSVGKTCYADCQRAVAGLPCPLAKNLLFAQILTLGTVATGEIFSVDFS